MFKMKYNITKSEIRKGIIRQVRERPGVIFVDELNFIEKDLEKLEKLENRINELYDIYKKYKRNNIENCEECQKTQYSLGVFNTLEELRKVCK